MIAPTLSDLVVPIGMVRPYGRNPRRGDVAAIKRSLEVNGQYRPLVVNRRTHEVLAGNHTLAAALELGWAEIAVTYVDVDAEQATRIMLADNRLADLGLYDDQALAELLQELSDSAQLDGIGYSEHDLAALQAYLAPVVLDPAPAGRTPGELPYATGEAELFRIVLTYDQPTYERLVTALDEVIEREGVDSYSEAVEVLARAAVAS